MKKIIINIAIIVLIIGIFVCGNMIIKKELKNKYNEEQLKCEIVGYTLNYIFIKDNDATYWTLTNLKTKETYKFEIAKDKKEGGLVGLKNGVYSLKKNSDTEEYRIVFDENNHSYNFNYDSKDTKGAIVVLALDKDENPVEGKMFNVYLNNGELAYQLKTDSKGRFVIENLATDYKKIFYVEATDEKNPKRYYFNVAEDEIIGLKIYVND